MAVVGGENDSWENTDRPADILPDRSREALDI